MVSRDRIKFDLNINPHNSPDRYILLARLAEDAGFDGVWVGDPPFAWDSIIQLTNAIYHTRTVDVVWALANPYTRSPVKTIYTIAQLDQMSKGRLIYTWGAGDLDGIRAIGYDWIKPVQHVREAITLTRRLLAGETVTWQGETVSLKDVLIDFPILRSNIPIYTGCRRPHMLQMTGAFADGVFLDYPPLGRVPWAIKQIQKGANRAKRKLTPDTFCTGAILPFSVSTDSKAAKDRNRRVIPVAFVSITPEELDAVGLTLEEITPIREAMTRHSTDALDKASKLVTDDMVDKFTIAGDPDECIELIDRYYRAGIDRIGLGIPYDPKLYPEDCVKLAKQRIIPYFKSQSSR